MSIIAMACSGETLVVFAKVVRIAGCLCGVLLQGLDLACSLRWVPLPSLSISTCHHYVGSRMLPLFPSDLGLHFFAVTPLVGY